MLKVLDLFSGIGGFSLGLERTGGFKTIAFCEIDQFAQEVLHKHWPGVPIYDDVRSITSSRLSADGITAEIVTGGFPCQDISIAGDKAGIEGERSGLWSELVRIIGDVRPRYAIVENVPNLLSSPTEQPGGWFGRVLGDLAEIGFDAEWHCIPASAFGAHFVGERVWVIASSAAAGSGGWEGLRYDAMEPHREWSADQFERLVRLAVQHAVPAGKRGRVSDGVRHRVGKLRALGNAINPVIASYIGRAILQAENVQGPCQAPKSFILNHKRQSP